MLDLALRDRHGEIMAVVAADDPADGRVPSPEQFAVVALLAAHAASALEAALASSDAANGQREAEELQYLSLSLAAGLDEAEILGRAAEGLATRLRLGVRRGRPVRPREAACCAASPAPARAAA